MLVINGVDAQLARNPLLAAFLRQHRGTVDDQCRALVPTGQDALSARYQAVSRLLNRLGVGDRKSVVEGKRVSVRVDLGGRRCIKKTKTQVRIPLVIQNTK